ncbi:aldoxime dehydratase [Nocardioides ginsengisegetis]|uniref:Aldoxime dehydratase n=1 Tax=Nocardioides ginsengisegetis TaxID=661491 RepID=A0A7W3J1Z6_9ACTN|nr:phenylacetaldoxime dehydratase family protein [Nocardioides ginsengisegetis]MBA8804833.1 aldoxime dehydratase [Nocardioides ginsengisegetis]
MDSAIDPRLTCPRTLPRRVPEDYQPPYPSYSARAATRIDQVVMSCLGVQYATEAQPEQAFEAMQHIISMFSGPDGPRHHDLSYHRDNQDHHNLMVVAYWLDPAAYARWSSSPMVADWWESDDRLQDGLGYFRETHCPRLEQFETIYGYQNDLPGIGAVMGAVTGEINEHGYWGSMRERFPLSQTDWMWPSGGLTVASGNPADGGRVVVKGHDNIAVIRSGQDWKHAAPDQQSLYLDKIQPTLVDGMNFLRDNGQAVGCYSNRFVQSIDLDGTLLGETYNVGHWSSLAALERWAETHSTHLRIFATFVKMAATLEELRLYHEVSVSDGSNQTSEYINCHPATGMMRDVCR